MKLNDGKHLVAYNYYQLRKLSWPWNNLVPGPWVHSMSALLLCKVYM